MVSRSTTWTATAGVAAFLWSAAVLAVLYPLSTTLATLLALPIDLPAVVFSVPVPALGAVAWWTIVERPGEHTYFRGTVFGVATALSTVAVWVLAFAVVWGPRVVLVGGVLVAFVLAVALPPAAVLGVAMAYARRRATRDPSGDLDAVPR